MMNRTPVLLRSSRDWEEAHRRVDAAPAGTCITFRNAGRAAARATS